jgi:hypothetical protein
MAGALDEADRPPWAPDAWTWTCGMTLALIRIEARDCEPIAPRAAGAGAELATSRTMTVAMRRRMMAGLPSSTNTKLAEGIAFQKAIVSVAIEPFRIRFPLPHPEIRAIQ